MPAIDIVPNRHDGVLVVTVGGRLDAAAVPEFDRRLEEILGGDDKRVILDLGQLKYISSMGLSSVLRVAKKVGAAGGTFALCSLGGSVHEVFRLTGFTRILAIYDTPEAALAGQ